MNEEEEIHEEGGVDRHIVHDLSNRQLAIAQHQWRQLEGFAVYHGLQHKKGKSNEETSQAEVHELNHHQINLDNESASQHLQVNKGR